MKRNIILEGELGEVFTPQVSANVSSIKEALSCIECNFPKFKEYLINADERGLGFTFHVAEKPVKDEKELLLLQNEGDITMSVLPAGSKSGPAKILAAIALVVVTAGVGAIIAGGGTTALGGGFGSLAAGFASTGTFGLMIGGLAINLAMTGLAQMMAPDPSVDNGGQADESYLFQGAEQAVFEGDPVPILYGKLRVPGRPVSFQARNKNQFFADADLSNSSNSINPLNPGEAPPVETSIIPEEDNGVPSIAPTWSYQKTDRRLIIFGGI